MAYSTSSPPRLLAAEIQDGSAPRMWSYNSTDSIAAIMMSGYFSNGVVVGLRAGDQVLCYDSAGSHQPEILTMSSATSATATSALTAGVGITNGVGVVHRSWTRSLGFRTIRTYILMDLTGLNSGGTAGDIIGVNGAGAAHIGQVTTAVSGLIYWGQMQCIETPAGGDTDFDIYAADEATGVEDVAISTLVETQLINAGVQAKGTTGAFTAWPTAGQYLYLVGQGTANATYTAGQLLITMDGTTLT